MKKARHDNRDRARMQAFDPGLRYATPEPVSDSSRSVGGSRRAGARTLLRPAFWILGTVAVLLAWPPSSVGRAASTRSTWDLEITADGDQPVTALVYGEGNGIHLLTVPAAGASAAERGHLPIRPAVGDVHMISLGRNGLSVRTIGPTGGPLISASARARSITLFSNAKGSGVRTGW
jgi:hypothetical protein